MKIPYPYQNIGAQFLFNIKRGMLLDEMGIGKTLQAILAALKAAQPTLVICPANLKINWAREIADQDPDANIKIIDPGNKVHDYATGEGSQWLIINYDVIGKYKKARLSAILPYNTLILDEAHSIKEMGTIRTPAALALAEGIENVYVVTGTPILNRPIELYPLLKIIGHPIARNWYSYAYRFCDAHKREVRKRVYDHEKHEYKIEVRRFLEVKGASNLDQLRRELKKVYIRRLKKEVLPQLPPKLPPQHIFMEMEEPYKGKYADAWERYIAYIERIKEELVHELGSEAGYHKKLRNLESSKHLVEIGKLRQITSAAKIKRVTADAYAEAKRGNKVLIFTSYTYTLDHLKRILAFNKIKLVTLSGATKSINRQKAEDALQTDPETKILIGNTRAAGQGINLYKACKVFFIDSEYTPALNEQAEDRAHRLGQENPVEIRYYNIKESIDEDIQLALNYKRKVIGSILGESDIVNMEREDSIAKEILRRSMARAGLSTALV